MSFVDYVDSFPLFHVYFPFPCQRLKISLIVGPTVLTMHQVVQVVRVAYSLAVLLFLDFDFCFRPPFLDQFNFPFNFEKKFAGFEFEYLTFVSEILPLRCPLG
jgi:hypothetical protein